MKKHLAALVAVLSFALTGAYTTSDATAKPPPPESVVIGDGGGCFHGHCCTPANNGYILTVHYQYPGYVITVRYRCVGSQYAWVSI